MPKYRTDGGPRVKGISTVAPISKGGFAATTGPGAVDSLGGIHRSEIDAPLGIAGGNAQGKLLTKYFTNLGHYVGPKIQGPAKLVKGSFASFFITNYGDNQNINYELLGYDNVSIGMIGFGPLFGFTVPNAGDASLTLRISYSEGLYRDIVIPLEAPLIDVPIITLSKPGMADQDTLLSTGRAVKFRTNYPKINGRSGFADIDGQGFFTAGVYQYSGLVGVGYYRVPSAKLYRYKKILFRGRLAPDGFAFLDVAGKIYSLTKAYSQIEIPVSFDELSKIYYYVDADSEAEIGFEEIPDKTYGVGETSGYVLSEWQIANNVNFAGQTDLATSDNYTLSAVNSPLELNVDLVPGVYYARVRHRYNNLTSNWSVPLNFTVDIEYDTMNEKALIVSPTPSTEKFGSAIEIDYATANRVLMIGASGNGNVATGAGVVYLLEKTNSAIVNKDRIYPPRVLSEDGFSIANGGFGCSIALHGDYLYIGASNQTYTDGVGVVYVFKRTNGVWRYLKIIKGPAGSIRFGYAVKASAIGLLISDPMAESTDTFYANAGRVYLYTIDNEVYTINSTIESTLASRAEEHFGTSIEVVNNSIAEADQELLLIGSKSMLADSSAYGRINAFLLNADRSHVALTDFIYSSPIVGDAFGRSISAVKLGEQIHAGETKSYGLIAIGGPGTGSNRVIVYTYKLGVDGPLEYTYKTMLTGADGGLLTDLGMSVKLDKEGLRLYCGNPGYNQGNVYSFY